MKQHQKPIREVLIDYVKTYGPQSHSTLRQVVLIASRQDLNKTHWGTSYIDKVSYGTSALLPTESDSRYLVKSHVDGLYHLVEE